MTVVSLLRVKRKSRDSRSRDSGTSLVLVLGTSLFLFALILTTVTFTVQETRDVRSDKDSKIALAAAQAGIDEYLSRLITDDRYWTVGNGDASNPAFTAAGRPVPGAVRAQSSFTYRLLNTPDDVARDGVIRLQVTGRGGAGGSEAAVSRTQTVMLRAEGFLDYLAVIDRNTADPDFLGTFTFVVYNGSSFPGGNSRYRYVDLGAGIRQACSRYWYDGRSSPSFTASPATPVTIWDTWTNSAAGTITNGGTATGLTCYDMWIGNTTIRGPYHSNDALAISGTPLWTDPKFETSWPAPPDPARRWYGSGTPSTGTGSEPGYWPVYAPPIAMPSGNQSLIEFTEPLPVGSTSAYHPGCRYTGITRIRFTGTTMKVLSPSTTSAPSRCYNTSQRTVEQTVAIPPVIYVDATSTACTYGAVGYPVSGEWTGGYTTDYTCTRGTALVQGTVDARVTVASRDDILITGNLSYESSGGTDMIGLIADNRVWVYHPVTAGSHSNLLPDSSAITKIQAAVLSLRHSFLLQNWDQGQILNVTLDFYGCYAQMFVGAFGTFSFATGQPTTGYNLRDYRYDSRLRYSQPPFFLTPDGARWKVASVTDG